MEACKGRKIVMAEDIHLFDVFEAGWCFFAQLQGHCFDGRDVGRLLVSDYWPPILQGMAQTAGIDSGMTKEEAVVKVKQEVARRLTAVPSRN